MFIPRPSHLLSLVAVACVALAPSGFASDISYSGNTGVWTRYMWRGLRFSTGPVWQSTANATIGGFTGTLWHNYDFDTKRLNEVDGTVNWAWSAAKTDFNVGWNHFGVRGGDDSDEIYLTAALKEVPLTPTASLYVDTTYGKGAYFQIGVSHGFEFSPSVSLNLAANAGIVFKDRYMGVNDKGEEFTDLFSGDITASLPIKLSEAFSLEPKVGFSFPLSSNARQAISGYGYGTDSTTLYAAIQLNASF